MNSHPIYDNDSRAMDNVWQLRLSYWRVTVFGSQLRKDFQPVTLSRLTPIPGSLAALPGLLVSIIAFLEQIG